MQCKYPDNCFRGRGYPVQNDFSALISTSMHQEFFLEELLNEINYLDNSIYHLDGPDASKHLNIILEIPHLNAIEWVPGAGMMKEGIAGYLYIEEFRQRKRPLRFSVGLIRLTLFWIVLAQKVY